MTDSIQRPRITVRKNGSLLVEGDVELVNFEGASIHPGRPKFSLCRCGGSNNKPFCDGSHARNGFCDTAAEVLQEG